MTFTFDKETSLSWTCNSTVGQTLQLGTHSGNLTRTYQDWQKNLLPNKYKPLQYVSRTKSCQSSRISALPKNSKQVSTKPCAILRARSMATPMEQWNNETPDSVFNSPANYSMSFTLAVVICCWQWLSRALIVMHD